MVEAIEQLGFDKLTLYRIFGSAAVVAVVVLVSTLLKAQAAHTQKRLNLRKSRYFAIRRGVNLVSVAFVVVALVLVWGVDVRNLWVGITGIIAMVAVAFFAVWSLIGNILAGILLYFTSPFKLDDNIEILPEKIRGKVLAINTFFTVLYEGGHYTSVPNSMLFQKYIVNYRDNPPPKEEVVPGA